MLFELVLGDIGSEYIQFTEKKLVETYLLLNEIEDLNKNSLSWVSKVDLFTLRRKDSQFYHPMCTGSLIEILDYFRRTYEITEDIIKQFEIEQEEKKYLPIKKKKHRKF